MDKTIQEGYTAEYVAKKIVTAVLKEEKEIMISPVTPKAATFLRYVCPSLFFKIMEKRAKKKSE